jgi:hypothetical protein
MWPANSFSRFGPRAEKVVTTLLYKKWNLILGIWKLWDSRPLVWSIFAKLSESTTFRIRVLIVMAVGTSLQVLIGHLFQVRTNYLIYQQRNALTQWAPPWRSEHPLNAVSTSLAQWALPWRGEHSLDAVSTPWRSERPLTQWASSWRNERLLDAVSALLTQWAPTWRSEHPLDAVSTFLTQ